jgi:hypothetical protein
VSAVDQKAQRELAERLLAVQRIGQNPKEGYCDALVKMGPTWDHSTRPIFCSFRARPESRFCGSHKHLALIAEPEGGSVSTRQRDGLVVGIPDSERIRGLESVRVKKDKLLKILRANRDEHRAIFEEAITKWHEQAIERLQRMVDQAKKGPEAVEFSLGMPRPDDHTSEYNHVIRMLELSEDDEFILPAHEFAMYVMDEWGWQAAFLTTTSNYSEQASGKFARMNRGE